MKLLNYFILILSALLILSCSKANNKKQDNTQQNNQLSIYFTNKKAIYKKGDSISIGFATDISQHDSTIIWIGKSSFKINEFDSSFSTSNLALGNHSIIAKSYKKESVYTGALSFTLKSDIIPTRKKCNIINTFPHDIHAYTQGLEFFNDNILYEGTGLNGKSSLRKVNYKKGEVLEKIELDKMYFGEGITILNNKIYQLTWQSNICFVRDAENFSEITTFTYPTEGWGLCNNGNEIIMSDGSNYIYFRNPDNFNEIRKIAVFDDFGPVNYINELEFINDKIYANIYQTNYIISINPNTGAVIEKIDCTGLLKPEDFKPATDVLNGIAYNKNLDKILITGKNWPKLFEVKFE